MHKINDGLTAKQRHFKKKLEEAPMIDCACGCGTSLKSVDNYARPRIYVSGHNAQKYEHTEDPSKGARKRWKKRNPEWIKEDKKARHRRLKIKVIGMRGNKCDHCSLEYNGRNAAAFEFHHTDPAVKDGQISQMLINKAWATVLVELDKCIMLCSNCHSIHHWGEW